jgi:hypothetical protein
MQQKKKGKSRAVQFADLSPTRSSSRSSHAETTSTIECNDSITDISDETSSSVFVQVVDLNTTSLFLLLKN